MKKDNNKKRKLAIGAVVAAGVTSGAMVVAPQGEAPKLEAKPEVALTAADQVVVDGEKIDFDNVLQQMPPEERDQRVRLMYGVKRPRVYGPPPSYKNVLTQSEDSVVRGVARLVVKHAKVSPRKVRFDSNLVTNLGLDSLEVKSLLIDVENKFNVVIPEETFESINTVGDIINFLKLPKEDSQQLQ